MGLLGGITRVAAVAGTATAVSNRVSRRQAQRWNQQGNAQQQPQQQYVPEAQAAYAPAPAPAPASAAPNAGGGGDLTAELERLGKLRDQGVLTDEEFAAAKAKLIGI